MAASIRIEDEAFADARYEVLGTLLETSKFDALGRMAYVWRWCTQRGTYTVPHALLEVYFDDPFDLVRADLAEEIEEGKYRIKGTRGRVEWLAKRRKAAHKGGLATRAKWQAKGGPEGQAKRRPTPGPPSPAPAPSPSGSGSPSEIVSDFSKPSETEDLQISSNASPREAAPRFDFETPYRDYPRKQGKARAFKLLKAKVRTWDDFELLRAACAKMGAAWRGHDTTYCPHFSTFVSQDRWRDAELPLPGAGKNGTPIAAVEPRQPRLLADGYSAAIARAKGTEP